MCLFQYLSIWSHTGSGYFVVSFRDSLEVRVFEFHYQYAMLLRTAVAGYNLDHIHESGHEQQGRE